jgi:uncharacterized membrane protein YgaE (UPF0421/DUF939 family)
MQFAFLNNNKYSLINAAKTSLGCIIGFTLGHVIEYCFNVEQSYMWIVITVLVVMSTQPNLGGALDKAFMRFIGTIISSIFAVAIIVTSVNQYEMFGLCLIFVMISVFIAGASSKYSYAGSLSAITMVVIILNKDVSVHLAILRTIEISQGIIIALLVNRFVFPIRAEKRINESFSKNIKNSRKFFQILFDEREKVHEDLMSNIFSEFSQQLSLLKEIGYESKNAASYKKMSLSGRRVYRYMILIYEYISSNLSLEEKESLLEDDYLKEIKKECESILANILMSLQKSEQVDLLEIKNLGNYLRDNFVKHSLLKGSANSILEFYLKTFVIALENFSIEHNSLVSLK